MMELLRGIQSRTSALKLTEPGPTREHLELIIRAGVRAPDHGRLRPWRFLVLEGAARDRLGEAMVGLLREKLPQASDQQIEIERAKALRAPTIVVAVAKITQGKIPEIEQICAVSAGVQNMCLAAHALGYGAMWKTGAPAYDPGVKAALGLNPHDHIVAFLYLGSIAAAGHAALVDTESVTTWL